MAETNDARARLIAAAADALLELTPSDLISAIGTRRLAARAGLSAAALYHHFSSVAEFADAVVAHVYDAAALRIETPTQGAALIGRSSLPIDHAYDIHRAEFRRLTTEPGLRLRLGLWALGGGTTDDTYGAFLRDTDAVISTGIHTMLKAWGREPRPPVDVAALTATHVALLSGVSVRHVVDPGTIDIETFARIASAITVAAVRRIGDPYDMDDRLADLNYFLLDRGTDPTTESTSRSDSRSRALGAAATLFADRGYEETTIAQVTRAAGISTSTFHLMFSTKAGLAAEVVRTGLRGALADHTERSAGPEVPDPAPDPAPTAAVGRLHDRLTAAAHYAARRVDYLAPYVGELGGHRPEAGREPAVDVVAALLEEVVGEHADPITGAAPGALGTDPALEVAHALVLLLLSRVAGAPGVPPSQHATTALRLLLGPIAPTPAVPASSVPASSVPAGATFAV
ncbi:helix-turn-helix domain-containing protein [Nocardioides sp.]|uniref:helix-turn-helix domain-containing protein n=1 Tax=Nocardioides sp. TaxID=35761 RepID=UPI0035128931